MAADSDDLLVEDPGGTGVAVASRRRRSDRRRGRRPRNQERADTARVGRRAAERKRRRRRAVLRASGAIALLAALAAGAVWAAASLDLGGSSTEAPPSADFSEPPAGPPPDAQPTVVLATVDEQDPSGAVDRIIVLAWDRETDAATVLLVPTGITTDLPGHGIGALGDAYAIGDAPLLDAALDNLLSIDLDATIGISRQAWASVFSRAGGLTVDVPERLRVRNEDGSATVRFEAGEQFLDGPRLAELLTLSTGDERELDALPRVQLVLQALLDAIAEDPATLDAILADGAPMLDITTPETDLALLRTLLAELAEARGSGELVVRTLPVTPLGTGEADSYRLDADRASQLMADRFAASRPTVTNRDGGRRVEIRNGNGVAGVSSEVAQAIIPLGFRVLITGNADDFDHDTTRIVVYDDSDEQLAVAREVRDALGVGRVELSEVPQGVVDLTIVVGSDYLDVRG
jgi:anionic cell wall polymer biosynthesis LytR-Cps2A-Psr (LCP) family protein